MKKETTDKYTNNLRNAAQLTQPDLLKSIHEMNKDLEKLSSKALLQWGFEQFDESFVLTTSFGIQSAVLLHMTVGLKSNQKPKIIWIDTGYLPKETYNYAEELTNLFELNLVVVQSPISPARMEASYGRLWETGLKKDLAIFRAVICRLDPFVRCMCSQRFGPHYRPQSRLVDETG